MAIDLTVSLTDAEQAIVQAVALKADPDLTGPQIKTWAEKFCKNQLRIEVLRIKRQQDEDDARAAAAAQVEADTVAFPRVI